MKLNLESNLDAVDRASCPPLTHYRSSPHTALPSPGLDHMQAPVDHVAALLGTKLQLALTPLRTAAPTTHAAVARQLAWGASSGAGEAGSESEDGGHGSEVEGSASGSGSGSGGSSEEEEAYPPAAATQAAALQVGPEVRRRCPCSGF